MSTSNIESCENWNCSCLFNPFADLKKKIQILPNGASISWGHYFWLSFKIKNGTLNVIKAKQKRIEKITDLYGISEFILNTLNEIVSIASEMDRYRRKFDINRKKLKGKAFEDFIGINLDKPWNGKLFWVWNLKSVCCF